MRQLAFVLVFLISFGLQSSPLTESAKNGDVERVKELLKTKVNINEKDPDGNTPLRQPLKMVIRKL